MLGCSFASSGTGAGLWAAGAVGQGETSEMGLIWGCLEQLRVGLGAST